MFKALKVRLKLNNKQKTLLIQNAGVARWAYNWALKKQEAAYLHSHAFLSDNDLRKELVQLKKTPEFSWLKNYSCDSARQAIKDACSAYIKFFKKTARKPKFKRKSNNKQSFYQSNARIQFKNGNVFLSKIGWVSLYQKTRIPEGANYFNARVVHDGVNWFVVVCIEISPDKCILTNESLGIDLGLKNLAICSNGMIYKNINKEQRLKKIENKIKRLQRKVSKKYIKNKKGKGYRKTSNIIKLEKNIKKLYIRLDNIRTDYRHKVTTEIARTKPSRIVVETLNIKGMLKNSHLSKAIMKQGLYSFKSMLKNKSNKMRIAFVEADKWFPSSKTCSNCGYVKSKLSLSERVFDCECCKSSIDRDLNASINLARYKF